LVARSAADPAIGGDRPTAYRRRTVDGLLRSIGQGIVGLVQGALDAIGAVLRGLFGDAGPFLPVPLIAVVGVAIVGLLAWNVARR
jgi:hypothetical protein